MPHQLSIVVTFRSDHAAFESTLVSVLENRPQGCEIVVVHDGSYQDPFDLTDEVRFAVASDDSLLSLLRAGVAEARAPLVHVAADGVQVDAGWTDQPLELFQGQSSPGPVTPVVRESGSGKIVAAGWTRDKNSGRRRIAEGATSVGRLEADRIQGVFLAASFWPHAILASVLNEIPSIGSTVEAEVLAGELVFMLDRDTLIATDSSVYVSPREEDFSVHGYRAAHDTQMTLDLRNDQPVAATLPAILGQWISAVYQPSAWTRAIGRAAAVIFGQPKRRDLAGELDRCADGFLSDERATLKFPQSHDPPVRRAA